MSSLRCPNCETKFPADKKRCPICRAFGVPFSGNAHHDAVPLAQVTPNDVDRLETGPWDVCFGGGIARESCTMLAGEPGAGKSSLLLQMCHKLECPILYISKEESKGSVRARADRLGIDMSRITIVSQFQSSVLELLAELTPGFVILDSLQGMTTDVGEVKTILTDLKKYAESFQAPALIVSQVNADLDFYGEMALQHLVDTTLLLRGKEDAPRILKTRKNRFGPAGITVEFLMSGRGLIYVPPLTEKLAEDSDESDV